MIIYKVKNIKTNKIYIGQTIQKMNERKRAHISVSKKSNTYFHRSIRKYGIDSFEWNIICYCRSITELNEEEN